MHDVTLVPNLKGGDLETVARHRGRQQALRPQNRTPAALIGRPTTSARCLRRPRPAARRRPMLPVNLPPELFVNRSLVPAALRTIIALSVSTTFLTACSGAPTGPSTERFDLQRRADMVCVTLGPDGQPTAIPTNSDGGCPAGFDLQTWH